MYLSQIEIDGFRGIKHLLLDLNKDACVFIGENRWGRSSLISSFMLASLDNLFYQCVETDFYQHEDYHANEISIRFTYSESSDNELTQEHNQLLSSVKYSVSGQTTCNITYQIKAQTIQGKVITQHLFLDANFNPISIDNEAELVELLISLNPMIQLKNPVNQQNLPVTNQPLSDYYSKELSQQLIAHTGHFVDQDLERGMVAARALLEYYLVDKKIQPTDRFEKKDNLTIENWNSLDRINTFLDNLTDSYTRSALISIFISLLTAKGKHKLSPNALPILILEEPESQLHPIILSICFRFLKNFPTQKIVTTNSSDFISFFGLEHIYHMIRKPSDMVAMHINENGLGVSDSRRILFHILYRRSSAMFARCWFLVEGETEIWLLRELAEQSGYNLASEGIQLIEFAQCGLKPLIKYANKMGIQWYVLTDGDMAGKKYASTVSSLCPEDEDIRDHLTVLPALDIEHFLFKHGFSNIYKMAAFGSTNFVDIPVKQIIRKAISRTSKPDLAIAVCDDAKKRGADAVPELLDKAFNKIINLANRHYYMD